MQKERQAFLEKLMASHGPSGFEEKAQAIVRERLADVCDEMRTDVHGNVIGGINIGAPLRVMFAGHVDEIGLMVTHIDDGGYLFFQSIGGFDNTVLPGQRVLVHGEKKIISGVIGKKPIHLMRPEERKEVPKTESLFIDIGAKDGKEAKKHVRSSDPVTIDADIKYLLNGLAACRGFDDRAGAFVVIEALREVARKKPQVALWTVATVQEEVGLRGARTSAYGVDPHVGIAVDVGFASDYPGVDKKLVGDGKIGGGPMIARGPNINPIVFDGLVNVATAKKIPYQFDPAPRATGTDANAIQLTRAGVATGLVSVPNRYMHSPNELVSLKDLDNIIKLLAEYVLSLRPGDTFIPGLSKARKVKK
jgi:tetrahedral aminopeptidase